MEEENKTENKAEGKTEEKIEKKAEQTMEKKPEKTMEKKEQHKFVEGNAIVHGKDLAVSTKQAIALCNMIRNKKPEYAIELIEKVLRKEIAVPMKGEIPHRANMPKGMVAGRYPVNASIIFIKLLRNLIANASIKGLDVEKLKITLAKANKAPRAHKGTRMAFGRKKFKRSHVTIEVSTKTTKTERKSKEKKSEKKGEEKK